MNYKKNIAAATGVLSLVSSLLLGPLLPLAHAAPGPWPSVNGLSAPTTLSVGEAGAWTVKASDPNNEALTYSADWGDTTVTSTTQPTLTHAYGAAGTYTVMVTVKNSSGFVSHTSATVLVENPHGSPLVISNVAVTSTGPTSERLTWDTNTRANSRAWLSTSTPVDLSAAPDVIRSARVFHHALTLNHLLPGMTYFAVAGSKDFNGNFATSSEVSFATTPATTTALTPPTNVIGTSTEDSIALSWTAATGGVAPITYSVMQDGNVVGTTTSTIFTDTGLSPSTTYSYVIEATDSATPTANVATSSEASFTTLAATAPTITSVNGPSSLAAGVEGTWILGAADSQTGPLTYAVNWGDTGAAPLRAAAAINQTSTFSHTYANAGTFDIVFTVTNDAGLSTTATTSVTVTPATTTALTGPTNVTGTSTEDSITLAWDAATGGVAPITYSVMEDGNVVGTTTDATFTDTGLSPSTTYSYVIEATDSATPTANVATSSEASFTTLAATGPTITSVNGPTSLGAGTEGTWTLGAADSQTGPLTYSVDWGDVPAGMMARMAAINQTSTFSHTYADAGTFNIVFTVTDDAGLSTTATTSVTVTTATTTALTPPTNVTGTSPSQASVILSWTASTGGVAPVMYSIMRDGVVVGTTTDATFVDTGLSPSTTYSYVIEATDSATPTPNVASAAAVTVTTASPSTTSLTAPANVTATSTDDDSVVLAWDASTGGVAPITYSVMRDGSMVGTTTAATFTDMKGLSPSTSYSYVIEATDSATPTPTVASAPAVTVMTAAEETPTFTLAQIATHNVTSDCWTAINGSVYNLTSFIAAHPGGEATIATLCGIDGTAAFNAIHGTDGIAEAALVPLKIGILGA